MFSAQVPTAIQIMQNLFPELLIVRIIAGLKAWSRRFQSPQRFVLCQIQCRISHHWPHWRVRPAGEDKIAAEALMCMPGEAWWVRSGLLHICGAG